MPTVKALLAFCVILGSNWELKADSVYRKDDVTYLTSHESIRLLEHLGYYRMSVKRADFPKGYNVRFVAVNDRGIVEFEATLGSRNPSKKMGNYSDFEISINNDKFISKSYFRVEVEGVLKYKIHLTKKLIKAPTKAKNQEPTKEN